MPHEPVPPEKREFARRMRRTPTEAEERLWQELRGRRLDGIKVRRQVPFDPYVADFLCADAMLVIEVDGSQHGGSVQDERRTRSSMRRDTACFGSGTTRWCGRWTRCALPSSLMCGTRACSPGDRARRPFSPCGRRCRRRRRMRGAARSARVRKGRSQRLLLRFVSTSNRFHTVNFF